MRALQIMVCIIIVSSMQVDSETFPDSVNLPNAHMTRYLNTFYDEADRCRNADNCVYKNMLNTSLCWGYESGCQPHLAYSNAHCPGDHKGWVTTKYQQHLTFFEQADFGYVRKQRKSKKILCQPQKKVGS